MTQNFEFTIPISNDILGSVFNILNDAQSLAEKNARLENELRNMRIYNEHLNHQLYMQSQQMMMQNQINMQNQMMITNALQAQQIAQYHQMLGAITNSAALYHMFGQNQFAGNTPPAHPEIPSGIKMLREPEHDTVKYEVVTPEYSVAKNNENDSDNANNSETQNEPNDSDILNIYKEEHENVDIKLPQGKKVNIRLPKTLRQKGKIMEVLHTELTDELYQEYCDTFNSPNNVGWVKAQYDKDESNAVKILTLNGFAVSDGDKREDINKFDPDANPDEFSYYEANEYIIPIFKHKISGNTDGNDLNAVEWDAFDIVLTPYWKKAVSKGLGGLTNGKICIIRLLGNAEDVGNVNYMSLYMRTDTISRAMDANPEYRTKGIVYDLSLRSHSQYAPLFNCFDYAYHLAGDKAFAIVEQVADHRTDSDKDIILSKYVPRTELKIEYNIFKGAKREYIVSNSQVRFFICKKDKDGNYVIKYPVSKV